MSIALLRAELAAMTGPDLSAALPHFCSARLGCRPADIHPAAELLLSTGASIGELAGALIDPNVANHTQVSMRHVEMALQTGDFSRAVTSAIETRAQVASSALQDKVDRITRRIPLPDFRPANMPRVDVDEFTPDPEGGEVGNVTATFNGEAIQVLRSAKNLTVSREALLEGDQMDLIGSLLDAVGQASGRASARSVAQLLMANANLADGSPWFDAQFGNLAAVPGPISVQTLSIAYNSLMTQQTLVSQDHPDDTFSGGVEGSLIICPPDQYIESAEVIGSMPNSVQTAMQIVALPELTGSWYLVGDPANAAIGFATLDGSNPLMVEVLPDESVPTNAADGAHYRVRHMAGVAPISRNIHRTDLA